VNSAPKIRVLIVDDSIVIRKVLTDTLSADVAIEVLGSASNGQIALSRIQQYHPDLVTLDVEMPVMDGLHALAEIRKIYPKLPVIMFSTLTENGAAATLDALALGASDYATKPGNTGTPTAAIQKVREELIPKIKALCPRKVSQTPTAPPVVRIPAPRPKAHNQRIEIVAIGTSTGGPNALGVLLPGIPKDFPVPIVAVQHMPPIFTRLLAERLTAHSHIPVDEGRAEVNLEPGRAWIAPGNYHMTVKRSALQARLQLNQEAQEHSCRPAVDVLFRSVASAYGPNALAVVMTGMGSDGMLGAQKIHEAGGEVIIQDEKSSVVWGMPGATFAAGLADGVFPLEQLAQEITKRVSAGRVPRNDSDSHHSSVTETTIR
jgi:two-component system chemotaxis response regulator CheB